MPENQLMTPLASDLTSSEQVRGLQEMTFLAEVARLAPQDRIAETTGAVLTASYAGLLITPLLISIIETFVGLAGAFVGLALLAFAGTAALVRGGVR